MKLPVELEFQISNSINVSSYISEASIQHLSQYLHCISYIIFLATVLRGMLLLDSYTLVHVTQPMSPSLVSQFEHVPMFWLLHFCCSATTDQRQLRETSDFSATCCWVTNIPFQTQLNASLFPHL